MTDRPALCEAATRDRLDEWALVLAAEGIGARVRSTGKGFALEVAPADLEQARRLLEAYERENATPPPAAAAPL